jgi:hypothetical protein
MNTWMLLFQEAPKTVEPWCVVNYYQLPGSMQYGFRHFTWFHKEDEARAHMSYMEHGSNR